MYIIIIYRLNSHVRVVYKIRYFLFPEGLLGALLISEEPFDQFFLTKNG